MAPQSSCGLLASSWATGSSSCAYEQGLGGSGDPHSSTFQSFLNVLVGLPVLGISLRCVHKYVTFYSQFLPLNMISRIIGITARVMHCPFPWLTISLYGPHTSLSIHRPEERHWHCVHSWAIKITACFCGSSSLSLCNRAAGLLSP